MTKEVSQCSEEEAFKLLDQLEHVLDRDPLVDEVGYIHPSQLLLLKEEADAASLSTDNQEVDARMSSKPAGHDIVEGNNAFFWNSDHKVGISTAYLLPLYKAAKHKFMEALVIYRTNYGSSFKHENVSRDSALSKVENEVMKHSKALLLLSTDFGTAWNARKLIISNKEDFSSSDELLLSALVLSFAPKSESAWSHRRWVIKRISARSANLEEILDKESKLVEIIAEKSKMNYRAWNHRCWLIPYMTNKQVLCELNTNRNWAALHVADNSCFHYRRKLLSWMLGNASQQKDVVTCSRQFESLRKLWKDELDWNEMLIRRYIGREALWLHRRFLSVCWTKHFGAIEQHPNEGEKVNDHVKIFVDYELLLLQDCLSIPESEFEDVQSQAIHSASYMLWLYREICSPTSFDCNQEKVAGDLRALLNKLCPEKTNVWEYLLSNLSSQETSNLY